MDNLGKLVVLSVPALIMIYLLTTVHAGNLTTTINPITPPVNGPPINQSTNNTSFPFIPLPTLINLAPNVIQYPNGTVVGLATLQTCNAQCAMTHNTESINYTFEYSDFNTNYPNGTQLEYAFLNSTNYVTYFINITKQGADYACINVASSRFNVSYCDAGTYHLPVAFINGHVGLTNQTQLPVTVTFDSSLKNNNKVPFNGSIMDNGQTIASFTNKDVSSLNQSFKLNISQSAPFQITFDGAGNFNYSPDDPVIVPSNIVDYVPVTLTNTQPNALAPNVPIAIGAGKFGNFIGTNALNYQQYYNCRLTNAEWFFANGTLVNSWLEGNLTNENSANSVCASSSSTNALVDSANILYWVGWGWPSSFLPANTGTATTNTLYLGWAGNVITSANVLFSNTITGEAPQLSCSNPSSTKTCNGIYAQYDDGANVFVEFYGDFKGSTLSTKWFASSAPTVANGLTLTGFRSLQSNTGQFNPQSNFTESFGFLNSLDQPNTNNQQDGWISNAPSLHFYIIGANDVSTPTEYGQGNYNGALTTVSIGAYSTTNSVIMSIYANNVLGGGGSQGAISYNTLTLVTQRYTVFTAANVYLNSEGGNTLFVQYARVRSLPPNDVMPYTSFGNVIPVGGPSCTATITNPTNAIADVGQYETFTATESNCISSFTYNIVAVNAVTPGTITHNSLDVGDSATSNTFTFQLVSSDTSNSPQKANVVIIDSGSNTVSSPYSTNFIINPALGIPTITPSNVILDSGQFETFTVAWTGGSSTFTSNIFNVTGSKTQNVLTGLAASPSTNTFQTGATGTFQFNALVTDSATTPVTTNSITNSIVVNTALSVTRVTVSNSLASQLEYETINGVWAGGTSTYTSNFFVTNSATGNVIANALYSGLSGTSNTFTFQIPQTNNALGTLNIQFSITDSASTPVTVSGTNTIGVNALLTGVTLSSNPTLPSTQNAGNTIVFTASWVGGASPYTANYIITNTITGTLITNQLYTGITSTSNTFTWVIPAQFAGNTVMANVIVTDGETTPEQANSIESNTLTIIPGYSPPTVSLSSCPTATRLDSGQSVSCTAVVSGGSSPYTYNWLISNVITSAIVANQLYNGVASTTNTVTYVTSNPDVSNSPEQFNVILTDSHPTTTNSIYSPNFIVAFAPRSTLWTASNTLIDISQFQVLTASVSGGWSTYTYNYLIYNSLGLCLNQLYNGVASTTNTYTFQTTVSSCGSGTITANILITDSANTPETVSNTLTFTAFSTPSTFLEILPSNSITFGTSTNAIDTVIGGSGSFSYQWTLNGANAINTITGSSAFNTLNSPAIGTYVYNVIVTDNGITTPLILAQETNTLIVNSPSNVTNMTCLSSLFYKKITSSTNYRNNDPINTMVLYLSTNSQVHFSFNSSFPLVQNAIIIFANNGINGTEGGISLPQTWIFSSVYPVNGMPQLLIQCIPVAVSLNSQNFYNIDGLFPIAFPFVVGTGMIFFLLSFVWLDEDLNKKKPSLRPVFLYAISAISFFISLPLLIAPTFISITTNPYNITTSGNSILAHFPSVSQVVSQNVPSPSFQFYLYMTFSLSMFALSMILLYLYMVERSYRMADKTLRDLE